MDNVKEIKSLVDPCEVRIKQNEKILQYLKNARICAWKNSEAWSARLLGCSARASNVSLESQPVRKALPKSSLYKFWHLKGPIPLPSFSWQINNRH